MEKLLVCDADLIQRRETERDCERFVISSG